MKNWGEWLRMLREASWVVALLGVITLVWAASYNIFVQACAIPIQDLNQGDLFTVLFGASSIALFILSILVAVLAILGWQSIKGHVDKIVDEAMKARTQSLENELRGRVLTTLGHVLGEMSLESFKMKEKDEDRLQQAIDICEAGYQFLQKVGGSAEALALNNFVFYSCAYGVRSAKEKRSILKQARILKALGERHDSAMLKLTACRALLQCSDDAQEKRAVREILQDVASDTSGVTARERNEARFYLEELLGAADPGNSDGGSPQPEDGKFAKLIQRITRRR